MGILQEGNSGQTPRTNSKAGPKLTPVSVDGNLCGRPIMAANFSCDLKGTVTRLPHFWAHTIGSCHAPLALRVDWQAQMRRSHDELGFGHVRMHGLLCDDMGTLIGEGDTLFYVFGKSCGCFWQLQSAGSMHASTLSRRYSWSRRP